MKQLFELATGENLTLESLRYYLQNLAECGRLKTDLVVGGVLRPADIAMSPDLLLGALAEHIDRFQHAVYNARKAEEMTLKQRKAEVDQELSWFVHNLKDEMGAQFRPALEVLGISPVEFFALMKAQLRYTDATLAAEFGEAKRVSAIFKVIDTAEKLFRTEVVPPLTKEDTNLAWKWMQRYTVTAFSADSTSPSLAFSAAKQRANLMAARAEWFARGDVDLIKYALGQLETDGRIIAA